MRKFVVRATRAMIAGLAVLLGAGAEAQFTFSTNSATIDNPYCPLPRGGFWGYAGSGSLAGSFKSFQSSGAFHGGRDCIKLTCAVNGNTPQSGYFMQDSAGDVILFDASEFGFGLGGGRYEIVPAFPQLAVGSAFQSINQLDVYFVTSVSATVSTPYRTFYNCIEGNNGTETCYICPGVGMVACTNKSTGGAWELSLLSGLPLPATTLVLTTNGNGRVVPNDNGKALPMGRPFTLTAVAGAGCLFSNWVGGSTQPYSVLGTNTSLTINMATNLAVQANFVANPFPAMRGAYDGLFGAVDNDREQTNSGAFHITVTSSGALSGSLRMGSMTAGLAGKARLDGSARLVTKRHGQSALNTDLQIDSSGLTVTGTVSDGSFVAPLIGYRDAASVHGGAAAFAGKYTIVLPGTNDSAIGPFGSSYESVAVSKGGAVSFSGGLADGTAVSGSGQVTAQGGWPVYVNLYAGKGSLWGWLNFTNGGMAADSVLSWINGTNANKKAAYRAGFTNQAAAVLGSPYAATNKPLLAVTNGVATLEGGGLGEIRNPVALALNGVIRAGGTNKLRLSVNKTTGIISGTFAKPQNPRQTIAVAGALLQNETNAAGYFLEGEVSGSFTLTPE